MTNDDKRFFEIVPANYTVLDIKHVTGSLYIPNILVFCQNRLIIISYYYNYMSPFMEKKWLTYFR